MDCHRIVGMVFGALLLGSAVPSMAQNAASGKKALAEINTFAAPDAAHLNPVATPAAEQKLSLVFPLQFKKRAQLDALIEAQQDRTSPFFQHWLTPNQVGKQFGASDADLRAVIQYAQSQGFTVTHVWPNRLFVSASATVAQAEKAFHIHINGYDRPQESTQPGDPKTYFAPDSKPTIPTDIASRISSIHGLTNYLIPHPMLRRAPLSFGDGILPQASQAPATLPGKTASSLQAHPNFSGPLGPPDLSKVYNVDGLHNLGDNGQNMNIGIMSPTQFYASDVQTFAQNFNITGFTIKETWVQSDSRAPLDPSGQVEAALDCEVIVGQANKATLTLYETDWTTAVVDAWNQAAMDDFPVVSVSWDFAESQLASDTALVASLDTVLATMASTGQSVFVATGDQGSGDVAGAFGLNYPASSPSVTAVGGTQDLIDSNGFWLSEQGWSGGGGGVSVLETLPKWQTGPGVNNTYSDGKRQTPDVAALSDPNTPGYLIYSHTSTGTGWLQVGGTSASTPLWASATLLMDQDAGFVSRGIGNLAPYVYQLNATSVNPAFHDIIVGSNATSTSSGKYSCTAGWDYVTGWGSADFTKLYNVLGGSSPATVSTLTLNPSTVVGGNSTTATITLSGPAPRRGFTVTLTSSNPQVITMPVSFTLAANSTTATFIVNTRFLQKDTKVTLTASGNSTSATATLNVLAGPQNVSVSALAFYVPSVIGGTDCLGTVTLSRPAPKGGFAVFLSSDSKTVSVPASFTIPAGALSGTFTTRTTAVTAATTANVLASAKSGSTTGIKSTLTVLPTVKLTGVTLNSASVTGGSSATGTVTLSGVAPAAGIKVTLTHTNGSVVLMHAAVVVPGGQTSATFPIATFKVSAKTSSTITATLGTISQATTLTVTP